MRMQTTNTLEVIHHLVETDTCIQQLHEAIQAHVDHPSKDNRDNLRVARANLRTRAAMTRVEYEKLFHTVTGLMAEAHERM